MQLLLDINARTDPIARDPPFRPEDDCIFIVHEESLNAYQDIISDGNETWTAGAGPKYSYFIKREGELTAVPKEKYEEDDEGYHFSRQVWTCGAAGDFKRVYIRPRDNSCTFSLLQYYYTGDSHSFEPKPHGNRKHGTAQYNRTFESVKSTSKKLDRPSATTEYKNNYEALLITTNPSSLPSGLKQIRNMTQASQPTDNIVGLQEKCKKESSHPAIRFILEIPPVPSFFISLAIKRQLDDLKRFCTDPKRFSVLGIDTMFNVGDFYVTAITYRHLVLRSRSANIGTHPVMLGKLQPAFFAQVNCWTDCFTLYRLSECETNINTNGIIFEYRKKIG